MIKQYEKEQLQSMVLQLQSALLGQQQSWNWPLVLIVPYDKGTINES